MNHWTGLVLHQLASPDPAFDPAAQLTTLVTATDLCWSTGDGPHVSGPIHAILLVSTGRLTALPQLSGEGAPALASRLAQPR